LPLSLFGLVLLAALLHVGWNALARSLGGKPGLAGSAGFAWIAAVVGVAVLAPLFVASRLRDPGPLDARALSFALLSALLEAAYFVALEASYGRAELSLVYPLSRGVAPLFALAPARAFAGDALAAREYAGVAIVLAGALLLAHAARAARANGRDRGASGVVFALLTGLAIAGYQVVDGLAVRGPAAPRLVEYLFVMQVALALLLTVVFAARGGFRSGALASVRSHLPRLLIAGVAMQAAYLLTLVALREGKIPLVVAIRSIGIPLSLWTGSFFLRERVGTRRLVAAGAIVAGLLLLIEWRA
jgi:uncharacterized membrane protein